LIVRLQRRFAFPLAAALGAAAVALPAAAASEGASIEAENVGLYNHYWRPPEVTVAPGATVAFANSTAVNHGVEWKSGPETPSCTEGVPVGTSSAASGTHWSGSCTFVKPGTYTFWCTVHGASMAGAVTVGSSGTTTTTTTPPTTTTTPSGPSTAPTTTATTSQPGSPVATVPGTSLAGTTVRLLSGPRGRSVRGSLDLAAAAAGGRLEVDVLARRAALSAHGHGLTRVGRLVRSSLAAGTVTFRVPLDARAVHALHAHRRLALTVRIVLTPPGAQPLTVVRGLLLRS
jgi:plastocyanin